MKTRKRKRTGYVFACGTMVSSGDVLTRPYYSGAKMTIEKADEQNVLGLVEGGGYRIKTARLLWSNPTLDEWLKSHFELALFPDGRPIEGDYI